MAQAAREEIELQVHLAYDAEAAVWYVAESDIPGLRLEAESASALVARIADCAGEMLALNREEVTGSRVEQTMTFRPVFDSPVRLAAA